MRHSSAHVYSHVGLTLDTFVYKDTTKPDGEACNDDGTLKDADDMLFVNSPSELEPPPPPQKRMRNSALEGQEQASKKIRVSSSGYAEKRENQSSSSAE